MTVQRPPCTCSANNPDLPSFDHGSGCPLNGPAATVGLTRPLPGLDVNGTAVQVPAGSYVGVDGPDGRVYLDTRRGWVGIPLDVSEPEPEQGPNRED